jgi:DNA replication protein DnaC
MDAIAEETEAIKKLDNEIERARALYEQALQRSQKLEADAADGSDPNAVKKRERWWERTEQWMTILGELHQRKIALERRVDRMRTLERERELAKKAKLDQIVMLPASELLRVDAVECNLREWSAGRVIATGKISAIMDSFGQFPPSYYVRNEEIRLFEAIKRFWWQNEVLISPKETTNKRWVLVGSPGVGKSTFLVLLAFYLARIHSQEVLVFRKLKSRDRKYVYIFLSRESYFGGEVDDIREIGPIHRRLAEEYPNLWFFIDGFTSEEIQKLHWGVLGSAILIATSSQYDIKHDDPTRRLLLPAWNESDLKLFASKTGVVEESETAERFYYSGGSIREFCRDKEELRMRLNEDLLIVTSAQVTVLISQYGGKSDQQVDRIRRHYVVAPDNVDNYLGGCGEWKMVVDSAYVLKKLINMCDLKQYEEVHNFARTIGGAFHGWAFEMLVHKMAAQSGLTIHVAQDDGGNVVQKDQRLHVSGGIVCQGSTKANCLAYLRDTWQMDDDSNYWYPDYSRFPDIDCIAKCTVDGQDDQVVIAYIQITVGKTHALDGARLNTLDNIFKNRYQKRVYIALLPTPELSLCFKSSGEYHAAKVSLCSAYLPDFKAGAK